MVFDILAVVAFALSSLCTFALGVVGYGIYVKTKGVRNLFKG